MKCLLFLIVASLPAYLIRFHIGPVPTTALELLILLAFVVWFFNKVGRDELWVYIKNFPRIWLVVIILWLVAATLAVIISPDKRAALGVWKAYFLEPILFLFVFVDTIKTDRDLKLIFSGLALSALCISAFAIAQRFFGFPIPYPWQSELRVTSIFEYPNAVGLFLAPLVVLFLGNALSHKYSPSLSRSYTFFFCITSALSLVAIILAKSEGALVGVMAGLFVLGFLWSKKARITTITATVLVAITLLSVPITRSYIIEKITLKDWSGYVRKKMWGETWEMLKDRPLLGAGLAVYQSAIAPYHKTKAIEIFMYPHNIILNFWSELGLFGVLMLIWTLILFFKNTYNNIPKLEIRNLKFEILLASSMVTLVVHGLVDVPYFKNDLAVLFWIIVGSVLVLKRSGNAVH